MQQNLIQKAKNYVTQYKRRNSWKKVVGGLGCAVVFCTTYALILPAITMEHAACGLKEHTHSMECYEQISASGRPIEGSAHIHTDECYTYENNYLMCPLEEDGHSYDESYYSGS